MNIYAYVSIVEVLLKLGIVFLLKVLPFDKLIVYGILISLVSFINTAIYRIYCHIHYSECKMRFVRDTALFKEIVGYSRWNLFGNIASVIKNQGINILLNFHFGTVVNAACGIASQVNSAVVSFSNSFSTALRPQIIKTYAAENKEESHRLVYRGCKFTFFLMYIFSLPLCLEMNGILALWLKNPLEYAVVFTQLVLIDAVIDSISYPLMTLAQATGKIKLYQALVGGLLLLNLPLSSVALHFGLPPYSVMLVAILLSVVAFVVRLFLVARLSSLSIRKFVTKTILPCAAVVLFSAVPSVLFVRNVEDGFLRMIFTVLISVLLTLLAIFFLGMTRSERGSVVQAIRQRFNLGLFRKNQVDGKKKVECVQNCTGCSACASSCPKNAIEMKANFEGFLYPVIDKEKCVDCGICEKVCPAITPLKKEDSVVEPVEITDFSTKAYAAFNNDEKIRMECSSGGIFALIAQKVIEQGGVVFGTKFAPDFSVAHAWTDKKEGLSDFRGSKNLRSVIGSSYKDCKAFLKSDHNVLFSGTPCQIQGLKKFLRREYENLLCVDFICHGVPSPLLWKKYVNYRENFSATRSATVKTAFRRKNDGWKQYSLSFTFANDSEYCASLNKDPYMKIFLRDVALRKSCYSCPTRGLARISDITLADFWGIEKEVPKMFDDKGTSLVIVHSLQGATLCDIISKNCTMTKVQLDIGLRHNPSMIISQKMPRERLSLYADLGKMDFERFLRKYQDAPFAIRFTRKVYRKLRHIIGKPIKTVIDAIQNTRRGGVRPNSICGLPLSYSFKLKLSKSQYTFSRGLYANT